MKNKKIKAVCDMFGENTVWNLLNIHGWFATVLGWGVFIIGNVYFIFLSPNMIGFLVVNYLSGRNAMWTCDFLLEVFIYKKHGKR